MDVGTGTARGVARSQAVVLSPTRRQALVTDLSQISPPSNRAGGTRTSRRNPATLKADLVWGVAWGMGLSAVLLVIALVGMALGATSLVEAFRMLVVVALIYLGGATAGGVIVGALRPYLHSRAGAAAAGALASLPIAIALRLLRHGLTPVTGEDVFVVVGFALLLGVPVALTFRRRYG
jgi:hypothetical protein